MTNFLILAVNRIELRSNIPFKGRRGLKALGSSVGENVGMFELHIEVSWSGDQS